MLYVQYSHPDSKNSIKTYTQSYLNGVKLKTSWHIILFMMKTTYPVEFCLAANLFVVILGQNSAKATTDEINTKSDENIKVTAA